MFKRKLCWIFDSNETDQNSVHLYLAAARYSDQKSYHEEDRIRYEWYIQRRPERHHAEHPHCNGGIPQSAVVVVVVVVVLVVVVVVK